MVFGRISLLFGVALATLAPLTSAHARSETALYRFAGGNDGADPYAGLIADQIGNLFGTTFKGGGACKSRRGCGTVFKLAPDGSETVLYAFDGTKGGSGPTAGLTADKQGNLYGTTLAYYGNGTVFEVTPQGVHSMLHRFTGGCDGSYASSGLIIDKHKNLFGTAEGSGSCNNGIVFEVTSRGNFKVLYAFKGGSDGDGPAAALVFDAAGNLYGTTLAGGGTGCSNGVGCGTVFRLTPDGAETVLYAFQGGDDGDYPGSNLILDGAGNLIGTTSTGGGTGCEGYGCGTVFKIAPDGTETILSDFNAAGGPAQPPAGVVMDKKGNLFGTTFYGGASGCGTVYKVALGQSATAIYSFTCGSDGAYPDAGLLQGHNGDLYGTTGSGGNKRGYGTVFDLQK